VKRLKESTREKLMESAIHEFSVHGFEGANVDTISINAGFGKGTIYNYFNTKLDIFLSVIEESIDNLVETIQESIGEINSPEEKLRQAIKTDVEYIVKNSNLIMTIFREAYVPDEERRRNFLQATLKIFELYRVLIAEGIESGVYPQDTNPVTTATAILGMTENIPLSNLEFNGALGTQDELAEWIVEFIFYGIKKKDNT